MDILDEGNGSYKNMSSGNLSTGEYFVMTNGNKFYYKDQDYTIFHRANGPAIECSNGVKYWYWDGEEVTEREHAGIVEDMLENQTNKIAQEEFAVSNNIPCIDIASADTHSSKDGKYITAAGEYLQVNNGNKYYLKDKDYKILHRENDLPAIESAYGGKRWYVNGKRHRENGHAIEYSDGSKEWWLNGKNYSENEWNVEMLLRGMNMTKVVQNVADSNNIPCADTRGDTHMHGDKVESAFDIESRLNDKVNDVIRAALNVRMQELEAEMRIIRGKLKVLLS